MRIIDFWDQGVRYHADNKAFIDSASTYTYREADREIHRIAGEHTLRPTPRANHVRGSRFFRHINGPPMIRAARRASSFEKIAACGNQFIPQGLKG